MIRQRRAVLCALAAVLLAAAAYGQGRPFAHQGVARDAERYETWLAANFKPGPHKPQDLLAAARRTFATGSNARAAARGFAQVVVADPANAEAWLGLAAALLAIEPDPRQPAERYDLPVNASGAAYRAYERAAAPAAKARALAVLGDALERRSYWRPAIAALEASLALAENSEVRQAHARLRAEHGFRLADYSVEQETAQPRLCLQFSEQLPPAAGDLAKYLSVDGKDPQGLAVEGKQLCMEGLAHGRRYEVLVRAGLPSDIGEVLDKPAELAIYVRDRSPAVRFSGRSYVLPSRGQSGIPVVTVNTARIAFEIYRIGDRALASALDAGDLQRQLSTWEVERLGEHTGAKVYAGTMDVASRLNEEVTTAVPVGEAVREMRAGVYVMVARAADAAGDGDGTLATQWFIVSDFGLTAFSGDDGIHAFVRSLATAAPVAGADVRLVARNNEILGQTRTDARGYARFEAGLKRGEGGMSPALVVAEGAGGDYAFLDLTTTAFDLSDRGVRGREPPGPIDAYLYSDRGVYRPGEDVHLAALVRTSGGRASALPVTLLVMRPDGVEHRRLALADQGLGGRTATLALDTSAMTGTWRARIHADPKADPLATLAFLVEDFVPERLALDIEPAVASLRPEERGIVRIAGRYLYGPAAANLALEGEVVVKPASGELEGYRGYRFGLADERPAPVRKPLEGLPSSDADGRAEIGVVLPPVPKTAQPLEASVIVRMREPSGRAVERTVTLPVGLREPRIGVKPLFAEGQVGEGETARFDVIVLDGDGRRVAAPELRWQLARLETRWQWYNRDGIWAYEAMTLTRKVANGTAAVAAGEPARIEARVEWGRYRLEVSAPGADGPVSSILFAAGWYADEAADSPEMLDVALDKASYRAGETARVRIAAREGGKALVSVLGSGLLASREVDIPRGGGEVALTVGSDWDPGAYVTVMLYRALDEKAKRMPGRGVGIKWLAVDQSARALSVSLASEAKVRSGADLVVPVKVAGLAPGEDARVTVAAVDLGILNLTRFQPPAPEAWFNGQRRLGVEVRDYYGRLIDGMRAERGKLRSGGDADDGIAMQGSPPAEATLALFSGLIAVGADGSAVVHFPLPEFTGTVRLMAVAWSADKVGHGTADVIVRDPVALLASAPRFLTLGDEAGFEVDVHNVELGAVTLRLAVEQESPDGRKSPLLARELRLAPGERKPERFRVKPDETGRYVWHISITGPAGLEVGRRLPLEVAPPAGDIRRATVSRLTPRGGSVVLSPDLFHDLIPARSRVSVSVGPLAALDVPGLLNQLDRYPYGCAEQTTSRALPLLYANQLAVQAGLPADKELAERIEKAIDRVFAMQDSSGAFGAWGPANADMWLTSYVTEFLTRAREQGFRVRAQQFAQALDRLQNFVGYAQDFERGGEARAYAMYVLARNGRAPIGEARYYADTRLERFATPLAKGQLGTALAMLGDRERAARVLRTALAGESAADGAGQRRDYGSALRDSAALLALAAETGIAGEEVPRLATALSRAFSGRTHTSTQEQAWMLLAARALSDAKGLTLSIGGAAHEGTLNRTYTQGEIAGGLVIRNDGDTETTALVSVVGAALSTEPPAAKGLRIERAYYSLDGRQVDLGSAAGGSGRLRQTDRLVVVLKIAADQPGGRILLVDRLPAGLEIENPRLIDSADVKTLAWLTTAVKPEHTEFRDDRFVAAFDFHGPAREEGESGQQGKPFSSATVAYMVRAVSPGSYVHPAATVEDMYRPDRFARTAAGRLEVLARE